MDFSNNKQQNKQSISAKSNQAFLNSLDDAEKALAGDPLQEAVRKKKSGQQYK
ncbi:small acid-soluble spore protein SspJ [Lentibacillus sp. Marseille-P4043]|uniref:small acid-soluble spore protein SspJ n=1 Tax=Lentibacillus sp. Marseille-P4043 TaxID=2040293 RepID=UPI000D0B035D|nr:small acid-soluble spore protein SspJ [Lentibacillus sp. Marseille-P4043]